MSTEGYNSYQAVNRMVNIPDDPIEKYYSGFGISLSDFVKLFKETLEISRPGLKVVPYRSDVKPERLKDLDQEDINKYGFDDELPKEMMMWSVYRMLPTTLGPTHNTGFKVNTPILYETIEIEDVGIIQRFGWPLDVWLKFSYAANSEDTILELRSWFRRRILQVIPFFRFLGIERMIYEGDGRIEEEGYHEEYSKYPYDLVYIRIEDKFISELGGIKSLAIDMGFDKDESKIKYERILDTYMSELKRNKEKYNK